jgi:riboflavin kinase/FMN adenylyltransferase
VVTVGTFDGLHLGHQKIIRRMTELAKENNGETILVTFDPHPRLVVNSNSHEIKFINTLKRKFDLLSKLGIDHLIIVPFTKKFAQTTSEDFIINYLVKNIGTKKLIVGYDHHFGRNREGNYQKLHQLGKKYRFDVEEITAQYIDDKAVSSTKIRKALMDGNVKLANKMLGYEYSITGVVVEGNKIGRSIGFPTANIEIEDKYKLIAARGVYACKVDVNGKIYHGMGNIGTRPTVGINGLVTEVHIFDFDKDIYGEEITIFFIDRIRDEKKFENLGELKKQLNKDRKTVSELLKFI